MNKTSRRWVRLGDISDIISGQSPTSDNYRDKPEGLPFYQGKTDFGLRNPTARVWCVAPKKIAMPGDILISVRAPVGPTNMADVECCIGRGLAIIRCKKNVNAHFVLSFLKFAEEKISQIGTGSVFDSINRNDLLNFEILLPPLAEQKAIAEVLSSLDDKIDLLHRQNRTLEDMAQTLFRQWFIEGEKADWAAGTLSDEFDVTMGQSPPGTSYNEEKQGLPLFQGNADFGFRFPRNRVWTTKPKRCAEEFDTLISVRAPVGEQNMAIEKCCIGRGVAAFRYKKNRNFRSYTYYKMKSLMRKIRQFNQEGTVFGSISKSDFEGIDIVLPPFESIQDFQNTTKLFDQKIVLNHEQIGKLKKLCEVLLPKLMNGAVRVQVLNN